MKNIAILGSTGSLGRQALNVIKENNQKLSVAALSANSNYKLLIEQIKQFKPRYVSYKGNESIEEYIPSGTVLLKGKDSFQELAAVADYDVLLTTVVGISGLLPTVEAIKRSKTIALANKETLVCAGSLIMELAKRNKCTILPVDSEHSAIMQCLTSGKREEVKKLIITASGGAFRDIPLEKLADLKANEALMHPNWNMGAKITIDCATMVNKGFEVIEAMHLFSMPLSKIDVVMHRESIVHSMVEYVDSSVIAQLSRPDMRLPLQLALLYPERVCSDNRKNLDFDSLSLNFGKVDYSRYPLFKLALDIAQEGGLLPAVFNAADEIAVENYLKGNISYGKIHKLIENAVNIAKNKTDYTIDDIIFQDYVTRCSVLEDIN